MSDKRYHIKVFVTKNDRFRASITEPDGTKYEVTIGGEEWFKGKGRKYQDEIRRKASEIVHYLAEQADIYFNKWEGPQ